MNVASWRLGAWAMAALTSPCSSQARALVSSAAFFAKAAKIDSELTFAFGP